MGSTPLSLNSNENGRNLKRRNVHSDGPGGVHRLDGAPSRRSVFSRKNRALRGGYNVWNDKLCKQRPFLMLLHYCGSHSSETKMCNRNVSSIVPQLSLRAPQTELWPDATQTESAATLLTANFDPGVEDAN
jgi:hypothetical protein